jgi:hypothetical protein
MDYVWFWTFWHWSKENFRNGTVLRDALHGIAAHWDEWFRHEASETDRRAIENVGRTESAQRKFILWLCRHWAPEAYTERNWLVPRFVVGQLAHVPPFNRWPVFAQYRSSYGIGGIKAVVLADKSHGEPGDIRNVEALLLPRDEDATASAIVAEEFNAEPADLETALVGAKRALSGKGLAAFLAQWLVCGRRPYPFWLATTLSLGWVSVVGMILFLLFGPEPGEGVFLLEAMLVGLWCSLIFIAVGMVGALAWRAWRVGRDLRTRLENSQVRLRVNGGLTLKGGSAGLPFCLNILSSLYRAHPCKARPSWLWQQLFRKVSSGGESWAATGVLTSDGRLKQVVLEPKLRACLRPGAIKHILTPRQPEASEQTLDGVIESLSTAREASTKTIPSRMRLGFAAEKPQLRVHSCGHLAQALMVVGDFASRRQVAVNVLALFVSAIMLAAIPDLRSNLLPYPAPSAVLPASPSPYYLWVSLDTKHPEYFGVVLESGYWSNRRADVKRCDGINSSIRAEMHFHRLTGMTAANEDDGVVWIERRRRFLGREFFPGERVGRYSISYLSHLGHE